MQIMWLAGLLEGEGSFCLVQRRSKYNTPYLSLAMTDKDVIEKAFILMTRIGGRALTEYRRKLPSGKTVYQLQTTGMPAIKLMLRVKPYMGIRRTRTIVRIVKAWKPKIKPHVLEYKQSLG